MKLIRVFRDHLPLQVKLQDIQLQKLPQNLLLDIIWMNYKIKLQNQHLPYLSLHLIMLLLRFLGGILTNLKVVTED